MSIRNLWIQRVRDGELIKLDFSIPGPQERRTVLLSPEINALISGPWRDSAMQDRCFRLRAELENILGGARLTCCDVPREANDKHQIGRLDPIEDNIFDIRSVQPPPALRIVFHFAEKDVLILHACSPRSVDVPWLSRLPLVSEKLWRKAISDSKAQWSVLFPKHDPHSGESFHDYLSNALVD